MSLNLFLAVSWIALGAIHLYRAYSGVASVGMVTLSHSDSVAISKKQRWARSLLGLCFLGMGIAHIVRLSHLS